jgi:hypothetical protein
MPFKRLESGRLVLLGKRRVPHDVREHYRSESALTVWQSCPVRIEVRPKIKRFVNYSNPLGSSLFP